MRDAKVSWLGRVVCVNCMFSLDDHFVWFSTQGYWDWCFLSVVPMKFFHSIKSKNKNTSAAVENRQWDRLRRRPFKKLSCIFNSWVRQNLHKLFTCMIYPKNWPRWIIPQPWDLTPKHMSLAPNFVVIYFGLIMSLVPQQVNIGCHPWRGVSSIRCWLPFHRYIYCWCFQFC